MEGGEPETTPRGGSEASRGCKAPENLPFLLFCNGCKGADALTPDPSPEGRGAKKEFVLLLLWLSTLHPPLSTVPRPI